MNYGLDIETGIDQGDVASNSNIAMLGQRRRQLAIEIGRCWMHFLAEIFVEDSAFTEPGFLVSR